jgi:hypothetical protein
MVIVGDKKVPVVVQVPPEIAVNNPEIPRVS